MGRKESNQTNKLTGMVCWIIDITGDNLLCKDPGGDRRLTSEERTRANNPVPVVVDDKTTPLSLNLQPTIDVANAGKTVSLL